MNKDTIAYLKALGAACGYLLISEKYRLERLKDMRAPVARPIGMTTINERLDLVQQLIEDLEHG